MRARRRREPTQQTENQKNGLQATWQPATWIGIIKDMKQFCNQLLSATILIHFSRSRRRPNATPHQVFGHTTITSAPPHPLFCPLPCCSVPQSSCKGHACRVCNQWMFEA